jgi:hypothetical protein
MNFLFPTFLFGLFAISIPIIIHLFNFRKYKKIYFTNVHLLKELKQESDSKSKLKELLILAMRVLAITALVFAFAQPFIPGSTKTEVGVRSVSIYVDNSYSMESTNRKGSLLENAKEYAAQIAGSLDAEDKIQLITNDFEGKHQRFLSRDEFLEQLNEIKISSATRMLNDILKRQQDFLQNSSRGNKRIYLLSDFQKNAGFMKKSDCDTTIAVNLVPIEASESNNLFIDSVWFESPVQQFGTHQILHALIVNKSEKAIVNGTLKLFLNGSQVSLSSYDISEGGKKDVSLSFTIKTNGINKGVLRIEDDPITYDDDFYFSFDAHTTIKSLVINGKDTRTSGNFRSLMQGDSLFEYGESNETAIDYRLFPESHIIVLNELTNLTSGLASELQKFVSNGGSLVVFPSKNADISSYNNAFKLLQLPQILRLDSSDTRTQGINFEQGLYEGVFERVDQRMDLPKVFEHFEFVKATRNSSESLVSLQNGDFLISLNRFGNGKIYLFSTPSDETATNLLRHALFVPTLIKMSILSLRPTRIYYNTGVNEPIVLNNITNETDKPLHIIKDENETTDNKPKLDIIPESRVIENATTLFTQSQITQAGHYKILNDTLVLKMLSFNFDRRESDLTFHTIGEIQQQLDETGLNNIRILSPSGDSLEQVLKEVDGNKKLWKLFLILALLFLLSEILIIRLFRN